MKLSFQTAIGPITLESDGDNILSLSFESSNGRYEIPALLHAKREIMEYLDGKRKEFSVPVKPKGTEYQKRVWNAALRVPYGETRTYSWIARMAGGSPRSAGNALGANPIPIIIPCHRVISKNGGLGGYSGGLRIKEFLLELEGNRL
jgi:methylated-DNA-[protein]-cysteine S-methyltransferase